MAARRPSFLQDSVERSFMALEGPGIELVMAWNSAILRFASSPPRKSQNSRFCTHLKWACNHASNEPSAKTV